MELIAKFLDSLVERVLIGQALFLQKQQGLRHGFEIELFRPTLIACALTLGQLCLNVDQLSNLVGFQCNRALALGVCLQCGKHCFLVELVTEMFRSDELRSAGR